MKRFIGMFAILLVMVICAGCANTAAPEASLPEESASQPENPDREVLPLNEDNLNRYHTAIWQLNQTGSLLATWDGEPKSEDASTIRFEIVGIEREEEKVFVTVSLHGEAFLDLETMEESLMYNGDNLWVLENSNLAIGESEVVLYEGEGSPVPLSCTHTRYENPATTILKANTEAIKAELEASQKVVDVVESYDPYLLQVIYREVLSNRWIEQPEDLTIYDLEQLSNLNINWTNMGAYSNEIEDGINYKMDAGLLRYAPNLQTLEVWPVLQDYTVFENMTQLVNMMIYMEAIDDGDGERTPDITGLKIGKVANLSLDGFRSDIVVDLTNCDVRNLEVRSWVAGVSEFKGCENIRGLRVIHTRTDTSIINAEDFPNAKHINLEFYSDYARFRNLANLSTFAKDVFIEVKLDYQAANNNTVASLDGVRINHLTLDPANGPWVLSEPDPELVGKINVSPTNVTWLSNPAEKSAQPIQE